MQVGRRVLAQTHSSSSHRAAEEPAAATAASTGPRQDCAVLPNPSNVTGLGGPVAELSVVLTAADAEEPAA